MPVIRPAAVLLTLLLLATHLIGGTTWAGPPTVATAPGTVVPVILVASGLTYPVDLQAPPGARDRLFIVEKQGRIRIVQNGSLLPDPFLDITPLVYSVGWEEGLLGMAFHPRYESNGLFYLTYSNLSGDSVVARYAVSQANPNWANPDSGEVLLTVDQPQAGHNGGQLQFGPDGYLYVSVGDGGRQGDPDNNAQRLDTLLGKILRIDVDGGQLYDIPADNPFVGDPSALDEIWSLGLRNPWRFSFDLRTGDMWIADVGYQNWEEVDLELSSRTGGTNWGWRCFEGTHPFNMTGDCPNLTLAEPVYEYDHQAGCAITGGYRYRGSVNSLFYGHYVFADYCREDELRTLVPTEQGWERADYVLQPPAGYSVKNASTFGQDGRGLLYITDLGSSPGAGELFRLELEPTTCVSGNYDVNGDGLVTVADVQAVAGDWQRSDFLVDLDVNCTGGVDIVDVQLVAAVSFSTALGNPRVGYTGLAG